MEKEFKIPQYSICIKKCREKTGLSIIRVGCCTSFEISYLSNIEEGQILKPRKEVLKELYLFYQKHLGVTPETKQLKYEIDKLYAPWYKLLFIKNPNQTPCKNQ